MLTMINCPMCHEPAKVNQGDDATSLQTIAEHTYTTQAAAFHKDAALTGEQHRIVNVDIRCPGSKAKIHAD